MKKHSAAFLLFCVLFSACSVVQPPLPPNVFLVGGKLDTEAQLLTKMYVLVLRHAGLTVIERAALGPNTVVFNALRSHAIDLYPEFTTTGLEQVNITSTGNAAKDYALLKEYYAKHYSIVWLDPASLNDTYGVCTDKTLHYHTITDLGSHAGLIATPPDGIEHGITPVAKTYGVTFQGKTVYEDVGHAYNAVFAGKAHLTICYTTSAAIADGRLTLLQDTKHAFPEYHPAPIIRSDALAIEPQRIPRALNGLAPKLTTQVSQRLQLQVMQGKSITQAATDWLTHEGLL